jgi:hypothetical protein
MTPEKIDSVLWECITFHIKFTEFTEFTEFTVKFEDLMQLLFIGFLNKNILLNKWEKIIAFSIKD